LALDGGEWLVSRPGCFTPEERVYCTRWTGGWVSPEPFWTQWQRGKSLPLPRIETWSSSPQRNHYIDWVTL